MPNLSEQLRGLAQQMVAAAAALDAQGGGGAPSGGGRYNGPVPFTSMTDDEKAFLMYVVRNYRFDPTVVSSQNAVWPAIGSGTIAEMNSAIADGDRLEGHGGYDPRSYHGRMLGYVDSFSKGLLKPDFTQ